MSGIARLFFVIVFITGFCCTGIAQVVPDSLLAPADTIVIYNEPVIIRKSIYIPPPKAERKDKKIFLQAGMAAFYNIPKYSSCDCYANYFDLYKKSTKSSLSYDFQGSITYLFKRLYTDLGVGYTMHRTSFQHNIVDSADNRTSHNSYNYLNVFANVGYRIRKNKFSFIPTTGIYFNNMISIKGESIQMLPDSTFKISDIGEAIYLRKNIFSVSGSIKILYQLSYRLHILAEPFYRYEISSATEIPGLFYEQKNSMGLRVGLLYGL